MKKYNNETFPVFLKRLFIEDDRLEAGDDPDYEYYDWLTNLDADLMILYAEKWHIEQLLADIN